MTRGFHKEDGMPWPRNPLNVELIVKIFAAIALVITAAAISAAQSARDIERAENERDLELRSWNLKAIQLQHEKEKNGKPRPQQALAQLQNDFAKLQVVNRALLRAALIENRLEPDFVSKSRSILSPRLAASSHGCIRHQF